jgi:IclR family transcriptional regulator, pca regulon regulatory protein
MIAKADVIEGAVKALAVLESFDTQRQKLNATQAAQRSGITRASARRHLLTLAHLGYLESEDGYYWLSAKVLRLSGSYLSSARLPRVVQPALNRLSALTGQSFSVAVRDENEAVIIARSSGMNKERPLTAHGLHLGARLSLTATSTGRVLLAASSEPQWLQWRSSAQLMRYTPKTITDWAQFEANIEAVRQSDFAWVAEEHELGVQALAVPVRNLLGQTVAALNMVSSMKGAGTEHVVTVYLPYLQEAAREWMPVL